MTDHRVLVAVDLDGEGSLPPAVAETVAPVPMVVLGYRAMPEGHPPGRGQAGIEREVRRRLDRIVETCQTAGARTTSRVAFSVDAERAVTEVCREEDCDAVLHPGAADGVSDLLVSLRGGSDPQRLAAVVGDLVGPSVAIDLLWTGTPDAGRAPGHLTVETARDALADRGLDPGAVATEAVQAPDPAEAIARRAAAYDLVALGPGAGSWRRPALEAVDAPTLVVRPGE